MNAGIGQVGNPLCIRMSRRAFGAPYQSNCIEPVRSVGLSAIPIMRKERLCRYSYIAAVKEALEWGPD